MPGFEKFGSEERKHLNQVIDTGILMRYGFDGLRNGVWKTREFEAGLRERMGVGHAHAVSSGTAALTVALASAGIGTGDEVLVPTFTFVASIEAVLSVGAIPVFCEVDETLCLSAETIKNSITEKTKAVMVVHMCGQVADLNPIKGVCSKNKLVLIEDACQAIGGAYQGKPVGSIGDIGCFSFDFVKTVTCGEGGALITNNKLYYERAHQFSDHGHDHIGNDRGAEAHPIIGYNYRISELHAAVGCAQLAQLDAFLERQQKIHSQLTKALKEIDGLTFATIPENAVPNCSFLNVGFPTEKIAGEVQGELIKSGIDGVFHWYPNNWHYINQWDHFFDPTILAKFSKEIKEGMLGQKENTYPKSDEVIGRNLSFLIKLGWSDDEVATRAGKIASIIRNTL